MSSKINECLKVLGQIRAAWANAPKPNIDIPGFDYDEVSRLIRDTEGLERTTGESQRDLAQVLLSRVVVPVIDVQEPSQSGLILFHQIVTLEKALQGLAPPASSDDIELDVNKYKDDIAEIIKITGELKAALPSLEAQAAIVKAEIRGLRDFAESEARKNSGLGGVQVGFAGISVSVATIREQISRLVGAASELGRGKGIKKVEGLLANILGWAQRSFSSIMKLSGVKSRFQFSIYINRMGQKAADGLLIAKRVILSAIRTRQEISTRAVAGSFSDRNYAIEYHLTEKNREYLESFLARTRGMTPNEEPAIVDAFLNPQVSSWRSGLQGVIFDTFKLKRETDYIKPVYWERTENFNSRRISKIRQSVEVLMHRISDANYVGTMDPADALVVLGFSAP